MALWIFLEPGASSGLTFGDLTTATTGVSITNGTGAVIGTGTAINIQTASGAQPGLLSAADWTTFNSKQNALSFGNLTASGTANLSITGTGTGALVGAGAAVNLTVGNLTASGTANLTVTGTGTGALVGAGAAINLAVGNLAVGSGLSISAGSGTGAVVGAGLTISLGTVAIGQGGTGQTTALAAFNALSPLTTTGDLLTYSGGNNVRLAIAAANGMLLGSVSGLPAWVKTGYTAAVYTTTAGQTISASSTAIIDFGTKVMDAGSNVTTGASWKFTAPASGGAGTYVVLCSLVFINNPVAIDTAFPLGLHLNGSATASSYLSQMRMQNALSFSQGFFGIGAIVLANSDYIDIRMVNNDDSSQSFSSSAGLNQVIIFKVSEATT